MAAKSAGAANVAPLSDRVVVKPSEETEQMRGGLYIPDTAKESRSRVWSSPSDQAAPRMASASRWK